MNNHNIFKIGFKNISLILALGLLFGLLMAFIIEYIGLIAETSFSNKISNSFILSGAILLCFGLYYIFEVPTKTDIGWSLTDPQTEFESSKEYTIMTLAFFISGLLLFGLSIFF